MKKLISIFALMLCCFVLTNAQVQQKPPHWSENLVWYQIFVERFRNGDVTNDPRPENTTVSDMNIVPPAGWAITKWTGDWFAKDKWMSKQNKSFNDLLQYRRYGGDLQGVIDKLDYLKDLGVNALYMNPLNDAPSLHKYDARNYHHIDVNFGPDPEGDQRIIESENPADPATWKWTSADKLFLELVQKAHDRGMKIIMDFSWNHTGTLFWAWRDLQKNQAASEFRDWYNIKSFDDPATPADEFSYEGWYGNAYMPEIRKTDILTTRVNGLPYEGDMDEGAKAHIYAVTKRWLAPDGDTKRGIDGYRLDVAEQIGLAFWRGYRYYVHSVKPEAYLVGEIWWEKWPDKLMDPKPYLKGDIFDAVMFYHIYKPARYFFAKTDNPYTAAQLVDSLNYQWNNLPASTVRAMMNVASSHDAPRLLTDFYNTNNYKYHANPVENPLYRTGKPDRETYRRLRLYLLHAFTIPGSPHIWNGDEMGMWGADDPFGRKPLWWDDMKFEPENRNNIQQLPPLYDKVGFDRNLNEFYKKIIAMRKANPVLALGEIRFETAEGRKLMYSRSDGHSDVFVMFNMEDKPADFILPAGKYLDLLHGKKLKVKHVVTVKKEDALILKKIKN